MESNSDLALETSLVGHISSCSCKPQVLNVNILYISLYQKKTYATIHNNNHHRNISYGPLMIIHFSTNKLPHWWGFNSKCLYGPMCLLISIDYILHFVDVSTVLFGTVGTKYSVSVAFNYLYPQIYIGCQFTFHVSLCHLDSWAPTQWT